MPSLSLPPSATQSVVQTQSTGAAKEEQQAGPPPPLRQDLRLHPSAAFADGAPAWAIQDPVTNRFYRIGWLEYECLLRWHLPPAQIVAEIAAHTTLEVDAEEVQAFVQFLDQHNLLQATPQKVQQLQKKSGQRNWKSAQWWLHTYLFIRVP